MTLKDIVRIIRRRILWFVVTFVAVLGVYSVLFFTEKEKFAAVSKISINAPEEISLLTQTSPKMTYLTTSLLSTWMARVTNREIVAECRRQLERTHPDRKNAIASALASVKVVQVGQTHDAEIRAGGDTPSMASDVCNIVARTAENFSRREATDHIRKALDDIGEKIDTGAKRIAELDTAVRRVQDEMNTIDPQRRTARFEDEILEMEERIRELENKIAQNENRLKQVRNDKVAALHISKEFLPAIEVTPRTLPTSRTIERYQERLFESRYRLHDLQRRYQPNHPEVIALLREIRDVEIDLTNSRQQALADALDLREFDLMNESDIIRIDIESLRKNMEEAREARDRDAERTQQYLRDNRELESLRMLNEQLISIRQKLQSFEKATSGYVKVSELSTEKDAYRMEKRSANMMPMALLLAIVIAMGVSYVAEFLDTTIKSDYELKRHLNYTMLGTVPRMPGAQVLMNSESCVKIIPEIFDTIATMTARLALGRPVKTIVVTSANPKEGKTTVSINLAVALARQGKSTLVIDGDLRIPTIHNFLNVENTAGFSELLSGTAVAREMILKAIGSDQGPGMLDWVIRPSGVPGLKVITCGERPSTTHELLGSARLASIFDILKSRFDYIVVDTPPLLLTGDALKIVTVADTTIFVIEAGKTDQREATWAKHLLDSVGTKVAGAILNKASTTREQYYRYYYNYGYSRTKR